MTETLSSWIDRNIIAIGIVLLCLGLAGTMLSTVRDVIPYMTGSGVGSRVWLPGVAAYALMSIANALAYNSVLLVLAGMLLRRGRAVVVGFEQSESADLAIEGPDADNIVWLGNRFANAFDAEAAANALRARINDPGKTR